MARGRLASHAHGLASWPRLRALVVNASGGPAYALFSKTNARGPAHATVSRGLSTFHRMMDVPWMDVPLAECIENATHAHSTYTRTTSTRKLELRALAPTSAPHAPTPTQAPFTRACCNYIWWPSVRTFLKDECTGPGARSFLKQ